MIAVSYGICFLISVIMIIYTDLQAYDNVESHYWTMLVLAPIIIMSYWLQAQISSLDASIVLFCLIDLCTTVLVAVLFFALLHDVGIHVNPLVNMAVYGAAVVQVLVIWLFIQDGLINDMVRIVETSNGQAVEMSGGSLWFFQYAYLMAIAIMAIGIVAILRSDKTTYSHRSLIMYVALATTGVVLYTVKSVLGISFSLLPYLYAATSAAIAFSYVRIHAHNISSLVSEQKQHHTARGYVAIGLDKRFLSCNDKSREFLPELETQRVDMPFPEDSKIGPLIYGMIDRFNGEEIASAKFNSGEMTCACEISYFSLRRNGSAQGYLIDIRDATQEQRNLEILSNYNKTLNQEVSEKTEHILQIQQKIVLGMADMVENRDSNTGGHVKRTSDVIQILVEDIKARGYIDLDDVLARDIVRAAPMHDLGKINIDSSILNKPGALTNEEFAIMKTHSAKSGDIVMILLDGVEEEHFVKTAFNVARYHHERWDGRGYPDGLVGEMIPLEARIMAIADVYDSLVSERAYKKAFSFEEANELMCAGMGTQFDPNLRTVYLDCRSKFEEYYTAIKRASAK